jgi:hypothetical protein
MNTEHSSANNSVDRILNALRDATPPPAMQQRILKTLELRSRQTTAPAPFRFRIAWIAPTCAATLAIAALIVSINTRRHNETSTAISTTPIRKAVSTPAIRPVNEAPAVTGTPRTLSGHHIASSAKAVQPQRIEVATIEDTTPLSHPAPPIPLTEQERLLLRYVRRGRTEDLAQISNESKTAKEQQDAAEFQAFFQPPITIGESE